MTSLVRATPWASEPVGEPSPGLSRSGAGPSRATTHARRAWRRQLFLRLSPRLSPAGGAECPPPFLPAPPLPFLPPFLFHSLSANCFSTLFFSENHFLPTVDQSQTKAERGLSLPRQQSTVRSPWWRRKLSQNQDGTCFLSS